MSSALPAPPSPPPQARSPSSRQRSCVACWQTFLQRTLWWLLQGGPLGNCSRGQCTCCGCSRQAAALSSTEPGTRKACPPPPTHSPAHVPPCPSLSAAHRSPSARCRCSTPRTPALSSSCRRGQVIPLGARHPCAPLQVAQGGARWRQGDAGQGDAGRGAGCTRGQQWEVHANGWLASARAFLLPWGRTRPLSLAGLLSEDTGPRSLPSQASPTPPSRQAPPERRHQPVHRGRFVHLWHRPGCAGKGGWQAGGGGGGWGGGGGACAYTTSLGLTKGMRCSRRVSGSCTWTRPFWGRGRSRGRTPTSLPTAPLHADGVCRLTHP